jgi:cytochrome c553
MKRLTRVVFPILTLFFLAACGTPAAPVPTGVPTLVLPTRVPIQNTDAPNQPTRSAAEPTRVAAQATAIPTRRVAVTPTITLIPTKAPPTLPPPPSATPIPTVDPAVERGRILFAQGTGDAAVPTCASCHYVDKDDPFTGPSQKGIGRRAAQRVPGQSAAEYLRTSILKPNAYIVPNQANFIYSVLGNSLMYQTYADHLTEAQVNDLVAYLLSLR